MNFEVLVKSEMIKQKITMTELAKILGVSVSYLSDIIRENRKPAEKRKQILEVLKIKDFKNNN